MPVAVACPKCKKKYNLPDKFLGKPVKCTACETQFKTPDAINAGQRPQQQADPKQLAAAKKAQAQAQQQTNELKKMGVDGPLRKAPDVFDGLGRMNGTPDPLANHVIEDPGFGEAKTTRKKEVVDESDDPMAEMFANPALANTKKTMRTGVTKKKKAWFKSVWFWLISIAIVAAIAATLYFFVLT